MYTSTTEQGEHIKALSETGGDGLPDKLSLLRQKLSQFEGDANTRIPPADYVSTAASASVLAKSSPLNNSGSPETLERA